ncbi:MAG: M14 family zinc carboxypeptidase, partial [Bradymonadaceae bacterium]
MEFTNWDGVRWTSAPREFGVDLNRNFPGGWQPFSMFGMYGGRFPMSEPESRAVVDTFAAHPHIGCALTMHTYTGCILTQPYRKETPLSKGDLDLMEALARDAAEGTGYKVIRVYPDFMYDKGRSIVGVWADTISTVFGVPGYTVKLWDPMGYAGLEVENPVDFLVMIHDSITQPFQQLADRASDGVFSP